MRQHKDEVSPECREFFAKAMDTSAEMRAAMHDCQADAKKFCKDVKPGEGRVLECLQQHRGELSSACAARMP